MEHGLVSPSVEGTPQGGPLSPLLRPRALRDRPEGGGARGNLFPFPGENYIFFEGSARVRGGGRERRPQKKKKNQRKKGEKRGGGRGGRKFFGFYFSTGPKFRGRERAKISGRVEKRNPGDHAKGQGRQHQDDNGRAGSVHAGLARLFRLLRNARGVDRSHSLGPAAIACRSMASVENAASPSCGTDRTASLRGVAQYGRQRPWPLVHRSEQSPLCRALQCPLQIARSPVLDRSALA